MKPAALILIPCCLLLAAPPAARDEADDGWRSMQIESLKGLDSVAVQATIENKRPNDHADLKGLVESTTADLGPIGILVCNAGGPPPGLWDDFSPDDYREAVELNLMSTISLCYEVIPAMKERQWGRIICIVSISAKQPIKNLILSNTARAGVLGFVKSFSDQIAPYGITVNSVCPGYTMTERVENLAKSFAESGKGTIEDFYRKAEAEIPMGRIGTTEEFGRTVAFLASEGAGYITGTALQIDGGYIKGLF